MTEDTQSMAQHHLILEQFGANAEAYVGSEVHARGASLERLVELLQPQERWHVLDIATGAGHTAFKLAPFVASVIATDITPQMLGKAQELGKAHQLENVLFETADAGALPYDEARFDLVTCRIAAHHFADVPAFVCEAVRVLRPGGLLAVVDNIVPPGVVGDYVNAFEKLRDPSHARCLCLEEWRSVYAASRLAIEAEETLGKRLDFAFWAQRHTERMKNYLAALLTASNTAVSAFLDPREEDDSLSFRLLELLLIGSKPIH